MASSHLCTLIQQLRRSIHPHGDNTLSDAQLLERWARQRDESAFEVLLWRHGPMVLSVCRRLLRDSHEVEDAFQAAFLTLVRKAASIRRPEALAGWLYRVAYRIALRLHSDTAERTRREQPDIERLTSSAGDESTARDLRAVLYEEIDALPERYRQAFELCYLEGKTHAEAGRLLGRPTGTISCWLKRGREQLRCRLARCGVAPAAVIAVLGASEARAALPVALVQSTCRAAMVFTAGGESASAVISGRVAELVEGAMKGMTARKLQWVLMLGLTLGMAATGAGMWAYQPSPSMEQEAEAKASKQSQRQEEKAVRTDRFGDPLPQGAVARLGTVRQRAVDADVAITPDGKTIVTLNKGWGVLVKFFDTSSGKLRGRWALPKEYSDVEERAYLSPSGRLLAIRGSESSPLDIWDVSTGKRQCRFQLRQEQKICRAVFSPDGTTLAVEASDKQREKVFFLLCDIASGEQRELKGHFDSPGHIAFSADGKLLAAEAGPHVLCWNVENGEELWRVSSEGYDCFLAFTPDGRTLIAAPDSRYARPRIYAPYPWLAWDVATGKPAVGWKLPKEYVADDTEFAVAPDNRTLVFVPFSDEDDREGSDESVRLWDSRTGRSLHTLAIAGKDGRISQKIGIRIGPFFPDGKSFLTNNGVLQRWELATGRMLPPDTEKLGHRAEVIGIAYSPDGRRLATASYDCTIRLWDVASGRRLHVIRLRRGEARYLTAARYLAFTPDGKRLVSGLENDEVYVWDVETGKEVQHIKLSEEISPCFHIMRLSADGRTIIAAGHGSSIADKEKTVAILARWDLVTGQRKSRFELKEHMSYEDFSPDGRLIAVEDESSGDTTLLDTNTMKGRVKLEGKWGSRYAFSADGRLVAGFVTRRYPESDKIDWDAEDYEIVVWETRKGRGLRRIPHAFSGGLLLAFSPDGRYLASAGWKDIRICDLSTRKMVLKHKRYEPMFSSDFDEKVSFTSCLSFSPDGRTLATGHPDSTILIWNAVPPKPATSSEPRP